MLSECLHIFKVICNLEAKHCKYLSSGFWNTVKILVKAVQLNHMKICPLRMCTYDKPTVNKYGRLDQGVLSKLVHAWTEPVIQ